MPYAHSATYEALVSPLARESAPRSGVVVRRVDPTLTDRLCRALNVATAVFAIVLTAPIMLLVALLVKLDSPGPVIYRQPRVGIDRRERTARAEGERRRASDMGGRIFTIYKFRTMTVAAPDAAQQWSSKSDQRVTRTGRVLRPTRLDELPQLFNVVLGDMNIVGPRPEQPGIFAELRDEVSDYEARQQVLPGITGWAQVNRGYDESIDDVREKVALDLEYIRRRSVLADLVIMAKTLPVMVLGRMWM